jgi:hypothetical protein
VSKPLNEGGCRCGQVRFAASADPFFTSYCHCRDCQRATGAPVAAFVGFHDDQVTWSSGKVAAYGEPPVERLFCAECGAPIGYRDARLPGRTYFYTAAMNSPEDFPPSQHAFAGEQLSWLELTDDLPRHDATSEPRPTTNRIVT